MKRINLLYDGVPYSIGRHDYGSLKTEINDAVLSGKPHWLTVNYGEGSYREAEILITGSSNIALIGVDPPTPEDSPSGVDDDNSSPEEAWRAEL